MASPNPIELPKRVVIIDGDAAMANLTLKQVQLMGAEVADVFLDANEGFKAIKSGKYIGAVIDWKLRGNSSGLAILSRLRRIPEFIYFPIVLSASAVNKEAFSIVQDFQCIKVSAKPLNKTNLEKDFTSLQNEHLWYIDNERNIENALNAASMDPNIAAAAIQKVLATAPNSAPLAMISAKHLLNHNFLSQAQDIYNRILAKDPTYLPAYNGKAKVLSKMGRYREAMSTLTAAQRFAPQNIERLCLMGEIEISLKQPEAAIENFKKALVIDHKDKLANIGLVVAKGMSKLAALQTDNAIEDMSIAKIINNLGVNLSQSGQYERALKYYLMSFAFVGTPDLQSRISFNMGLGFKRWSKLPQSKYWFEKSIKISNGKYTKASPHLAKMADIVAMPGMVDPNEPPTTQSVQTQMPPDSMPMGSTKITSSQEIEDLSFLEEESVSSPNSSQSKGSPAAANVFQNMIIDIDNLSKLEDDFSFDDVI